MGTIFGKILIIFILISVLPVGLSFYLLRPVSIEVFLVVFSVLALLIVFFSVFISRKLTRPINDLVRDVREISKGSFDVKFKVSSKDELFELSGAFNEMVSKLKEQRERELLAARIKTEFISIAAHQLRTPLSAIKWILRMILDGDFGALNPEQAGFLKRGYSANERMIGLVNDLLDVSRMEEGRFGFEFEKGDLNEVVREVVDSHKPMAVTKKISLSLKARRSLLTMLLDASRMKMALSNLIDNALNYTPAGGSVEVSVIEKEDEIEIVIKDNGVGISEKHKHRIFGKFFRGDNVVRMQTEGTGLGLYLAKNIIEKHGGLIRFESKENKGFFFY